MGLFDLFKKKKAPAVTVAFESKPQMPQQAQQYNVWERQTYGRNDDFAIAAFISYSQKGAKIGKTNDDYPRYFAYEYKVNDPVKYHKKVIADGYLDIAEADVALQAFKVDQLKAILANNGLSETGKKEALILRILANVDTDSLNLETYYIPSPKGWEHFHKYEHILTLKNYGISWEQYVSYSKTRPDYLKPNDIIWQMLNARKNAHLIGGDFGLARNEILNMAKLLESEEKYTDALLHYISVLYFDVSGCANGGRVDPVDSLTIAPAIVRSIFNLKEYYSEQITERCYRQDLPNQYVSVGKFRKLLQDIFNDETLDISNYLK